MDPQRVAFLLFLALCVGTIVLLVVRHFVCWYFRINERAELLRRQTDLLASMDRSLAEMNALAKRGSPLHAVKP